jgi:hypothetical protein
MRQQSLVSIVKDKVMADSVGKNKAGNVVVRKGYFYTQGKTVVDFEDRVVRAMSAAGHPVRVVDRGTVWKPFRGGATTANQSHWWVEITEETV